MAETKEYRHNFGLLLLVIFIIVSLLLIYLTAYTKYIFAKDYYFYIETPCNPDTHTCFVRDCDEYCPPNGLAEYRAFSIPAYIFPNCEDNSCTNICLVDSDENKICQETICSTESGDDCSNAES